MKGFVARMSVASEDEAQCKRVGGGASANKSSVTGQCEVLSTKLDALLQALETESTLADQILTRDDEEEEEQISEEAKEATDKTQFNSIPVTPQQVCDYL